MRGHGFGLARLALAMLIARFAAACFLPEYKEEESSVKGSGGSFGTGGRSVVKGYGGTTGTGGAIGTGGTKVLTSGLGGAVGTGGYSVIGTGGTKPSTGGSGGGGTLSCTISATSYPSGTASSTNACQYCNPAQSTTSWSARSDGTTCSGGSVCYGGTCSPGCYIGSSLYASGAANSSNKCQVCQPSSSTTTWSSSVDGASCGTGSVCYRGSCSSGCWIGATYYASSATNPSNACQKCSPSTSTAAWASASDSTGCGSYSRCTSGQCQAYPDLVLDSFDITYYRSGSTFTICLNSDTDGNSVSNGDFVKVTNHGAAAAGPFIVRVGLQEVSSGIGHYFTQSYLNHPNNLNPDYTSTWSGPTCIAANVSNLPATQYYLAMKADYDNAVAEYDETNNIATGSSAITLP